MHGFAFSVCKSRYKTNKKKTTNTPKDARERTHHPSGPYARFCFLSLQITIPDVVARPAQPMRAVAISTAPDFWFAVEYPLTLALQEAGEETRTHSVRLVRLRILTITKSCLLSRVNGGVPLVSSKPASGLLCVVRKRHGIEHLQRAGRHVGTGA